MLDVRISTTQCKPQLHENNVTLVNVVRITNFPAYVMTGATITSNTLKCAAGHVNFNTGNHSEANQYTGHCDQTRGKTTEVRFPEGVVFFCSPQHPNRFWGPPIPLSSSVQLPSLNKAARTKATIHSCKKRHVNIKVFPLYIGSSLCSDHESKYNMPPTIKHAKKMAIAYEINSAKTEHGSFMNDNVTDERSELFFQSRSSLLTTAAKKKISAVSGR